MKSVDPKDIERIAELNQQLLAAQAPFSDNITEFNETCKELYERLIREPKEKYDKCVEELNELYQTVQAAQHEFFDSQPASWQQSDDGQAYAEWMEVWSRSEDPFDIEDFDELIEPRLLDESDFPDMPADPGEIKYLDQVDNGEQAQASMIRQQLLAAWRDAVVAGKTQLGFPQWLESQPAARRAKSRPSNYAMLSPDQRWQIDRVLGLLDWDGK